MPNISIAARLQDLGLGQYADAFTANDIDGDILATLTDADLRELGVASLGHRKKVLQAISLFAAPAELGASSAPRQASPPNIPRHLAERILAARETLIGERKAVTVLFADIHGSFALIEDL